MYCFYIMYLCDIFMCFVIDGRMCNIHKLWSGAFSFTFSSDLCVDFQALSPWVNPATLWKKHMLVVHIYDLIFSVTTQSSRPIAEVWSVHWLVNRELESLTFWLIATETVCLFMMQIWLNLRFNTTSQNKPALFCINWFIKNHTTVQTSDYRQM